MSTKSTPAKFVDMQLGAPNEPLVGNTTVTMRVNRYYTDGSLLKKDFSYLVTREWARMAVDYAWAYEASALKSLPPTDAENFTAMGSTLLSNTGNGVYNFNPALYPKTKAAIANVRLGKGNATFFCIGDSITVGYDGVTPANEVVKSWVTRAAATLSASGLYSSAQSWWNDKSAASVSSTLPVIDTRMTIGAGFANLFGGGSLGGTIIGGNNSTINVLGFTPTVPTNAYAVYYFDVAGYDTINFFSGTGGVTSVATVNGAAASTLTPTGSGGTGKIRKATVATGVAAANNIWNTRKTLASAPNMVLAGGIAYDTAKPEISLVNMGAHSALLSQLLDNSAYFRSLGVLTIPDNATVGTSTIFLMIGTNNILQNQLSTFQADYLRYVTALQAAGSELVLMIPPWVLVGTNQATQANQEFVAATIYAVAQATGCAVIDNQKITPFVASNYGDGNVHPTDVYSQQIATGVTAFILALA